MTNKFVGADVGSDDVVAYTMMPDEFQMWTFTRNSDDGSYKITNAKSGKNLDLMGGSATSGTDIITYGDVGSDAQRWFLVPKDGGYVFQCKASRSNALDLADGSTKLER